MARNFALSAAQLEALEACHDGATLERWVVEAALATTPDEALG